MNTIYIGLGYLTGPTAQIGYGYGPWRVYGQASPKQEYGGGLTFDAVKW
jgi:hypothetical protein